jgi:hypothetical protein
MQLVENQSDLLKVCVYCGSIATTRDHVPPKLLLERPYPTDLWTVPACRDCNNGFSSDEEYLLVAMAHTGCVDSLINKVNEGGVVDRALQRAERLDDRIINALNINEDGHVYFVPEYERIQRIICKIATGLFFRFYGRRPNGPICAPAVYHADALPLPVFASTLKYPEQALRPEINTRVRKISEDDDPISKPWVRIQDKVFEFMFVTQSDPRSGQYCIMNLHQILWGVVGCPPPPS